MSKKTLDLAIHILRQINDYDLSEYIPIKFNDKNIGWAHISTLSSIPNIKTPCKHLDIRKIIDFTNQSVSRKRELEYCPIFDFESLKPKLKFDHKKNFVMEENSS